MDNNNNFQYQPNNANNGSGAATGSLVCGILSVVAAWFGWIALVSVVLGIVGIILAVNAKKQGCSSGSRTAGLVLSIIGLVFGGIVFVACALCAGALASAASVGQYTNYMY